MAKRTTKKTGKRGKKSPSLIGRTASSLGAMAARHPGKIGGPLVFGVVFSFVSANALWYQPGPHPSPMMKTRQPSNPYAVPGRRMAKATEFESFRIELEDGEPAKAEKFGDDLLAILEQVEANPPSATGAAVEKEVAAPAPPAPIDDEPDILALQQALAARGYYKGKPDGVTGPLTKAAIRAFQSDSGIAPTGEPDEEVVALLSVSAPLPQPRPETATARDPIGEILKQSPPAGNAEIAAADPMVIEIQRGLVNIAYDGVVVDGVAGATTRAAILEFQKHYRLPETGQPSEAVRNKLREIGAL